MRIIMLMLITTLITSCSLSNTSNTNDDTVVVTDDKKNIVNAGATDINDTPETSKEDIRIWTKNIRSLQLFKGDNHLSVVYAYDKNKSRVPDYFKDKLVDYNFTVVEGLDGLSVSKEGLLSYDIPADAQHGIKKAYFRANNMKNNDFKDFDMEFYIMETRIVLEGEIGPEGGVLKNDEISVEFPEGSFRAISKVKFLEGIGIEGQQTSGMTSSDPMLKLASTTYLD